LGIAATRAAGLKSMFGTPCKPLHVGMAASAGQLAASLAARGFESREDVLECPQGFAATHSPDFNPEAAMRDPDSGYHIYNNLFKFHASCYDTQATIECGQHIRKRDGFSLDDVLAINVRANTHCDEICNIAEPKTGMETKFSLRAVAAFALAGLDTSRPEVFSDTNARSSVLSGLRDKVTVQLTPDLVLTESEVEVELRSGKMIHARRDAGVPMRDRAAQGRRVAEKFHSLVEPIVGKIRSKQIHLEVNQLEELSDIAPLMALCQKI
jgi:2-methylcitrate dehydratase PrpD